MTEYEEVIELANSLNALSRQWGNLMPDEVQQEIDYLTVEARELALSLGADPHALFPAKDLPDGDK